MIPSFGNSKKKVKAIPPQAPGMALRDKAGEMEMGRKKGALID